MAAMAMAASLSPAVVAQQVHLVKVAINQGPECGNVLGLEERQSPIKVYPVPASAYVNIEAPEAIKDIKLYDLSGRLRQEFEAESTLIRVETGDLQKGIYVLSVTTRSGVVQYKIAIDR